MGFSEPLCMGWLGDELGKKVGVYFSQYPRDRRFRHRVDAWYGMGID